MTEKMIQRAAIFGALAVIIGAFGAHGLKPHLDAYQQGIFEKGVQYQFYHTLALLGAGLASRFFQPSNWLRWSSRLFQLGILCFSGSLYLLACRDLLPFPVGWAGPVTPLGGLCFIGGWIGLLLGIRRQEQ
ncbi:MAG: DUF423 domain-containing protein [Bacteroidetes bacterium]|nr:MAG: DUF423 domain-containing protein [Bacteroidota bacterium]